MTVIDLRDELYTRQIEIIEMTDDFIYYAEELKLNGVDTICIYSYSFESEEESAMSVFEFSDTTYVQHYYACNNSIIVLFENNGNMVWIVKVDKVTGEEVYRKRLGLIGNFSDCIAIDDDNLMIYTKSNSQYRELFNRCREVTNGDILAHLYNIEENERHFIRDFETAWLVKNSMHKFTASNGNEYMLFTEPCFDEDVKESLFNNPLISVEAEIRDGLWIISKKKFLKRATNNEADFELKKLADSGADGFIKFECISNGNVILHAKVFESGNEQFVALSTVSGNFSFISNAKRNDENAYYFTDEQDGKVYYMTRDLDSITMNGEINSKANITFSYNIGKLMCCIEDRFVIADKSLGIDEPFVSIYDSKLKLTDTYQAHAKAKGETVVLF